MRATGVGSMPGEDVEAALRIITTELQDGFFVPELPGRGAPAQMVGRSLGLLVDLAVDLQPAGWRLTGASGIDQRRARSLLAHDLDLVEEHLAGREPATFKQQIAGPWTLAASVERPRGEKLLSDHGARRELAESLSEGVAVHLAEVRRRRPDDDLLVQIDEPSLGAVLAAEVPTASGFGRLRGVERAEVQSVLAGLVDRIRAAGATPVVHCCAREVPVDVLAAAGFAAVSVDVAAVGERALVADERWADATTSGVVLWPGVVEIPAGDDPGRLRERVETLAEQWGSDADGLVAQVVTPACGLAGTDHRTAAEALAMAQRVADPAAPRR